jgi:hypothetical protein
VFCEFGQADVHVRLGLHRAATPNLLYIAASDMLPELQEHTHRDHFFKTFFSTVAGLVLITALLMWSHSAFGENHDEDERVHVEKIADEL